MRILVLDDNEIIRKAPDEIFTDAYDYRGDEIVQTRAVRVFVKKFFTETWDMVWIDHDLGTGHITGRTATKDIYDYMLGSGRKVISNPRIWITTMNSSASESMASDMRACGFVVSLVPISMLSHCGISRGDFIAL